MSSFFRYLVKRVVSTVITLFVVAALVFAVTQVLPGNAARMIAGRHASEERIEVIESELGLNRPIPVQFVDWITGILSGDWGVSYMYSEPVAEAMIPRLLRSLELALVTLGIVLTIAIPIGIVTALRRGTLTDMVLSSGTYVGVSIPEYVMGTLLILLLAGPMFNVLPSGGYVPLSEGVVPWSQHLILPALSLTFVLTGHVMRQTRSEMVETLQSDYVRTARLKGLGEYQVVVRHAMPNALLPTITVVALDFGYLLGGIVVVEEVFIYPGVGRMVVAAIMNRDLPVIQMGVLIIASAYVLANFAADLLYTSLDPRISYGGE
jgi:peptide/nickel transport system permease protein